jgi:hypothetical protein
VDGIFVKSIKALPTGQEFAKMIEFICICGHERRDHVGLHEVYSKNNKFCLLKLNDQNYVDTCQNFTPDKLKYLEQRYEQIRKI